MGEYFGSRCQGKRRGKYFSQLNLVNVDCRNVPVLVDYAQSRKESCRKSKNVQSQGVYLRSGVSGFE